MECPFPFAGFRVSNPSPSHLKTSYICISPHSQFDLGCFLSCKRYYRCCWTVLPLQAVLPLGNHGTTAESGTTGLLSVFVPKRYYRFLERYYRLEGFGEGYVGGQGSYLPIPLHLFFPTTLSLSARRTAAAAVSGSPFPRHLPRFRPVDSIPTTPSCHGRWYCPRFSSLGFYPLNLGSRAMRGEKSILGKIMA